MYWMVICQLFCAPIFALSYGAQILPTLCIAVYVRYFAPSSLIPVL